MSKHDLNDPFADPPSSLPYEHRQHEAQQAQRFPPASPSAPYQSFQPPFKAPMNTQGDPRNAMGLPHDVDGRRDWSHSIFSCFDRPETCCLSCWCPCVMYSRNKSRLHHLSEFNVKHPQGGDSVSSDCFLHCCLNTVVGLGWLLQIGTRGATRDRYKIQGGACEDCVSIWACNPCTITQETREIELEEQFSQEGLPLKSRRSEA
ncbi:PLAC8 family-domain-containing protein [Mrakia frigida]|uniref:PLAC8 family protein n=1 Tax=Mrakia frigida TaxID=29902 RepID=UPI003FCC0FAB